MAENYKNSSPPKKALHTKKASRKVDVLGPLYATRPDAVAAADEIAQRQNLDPAWVRKAIGQARYLPSIARAITPAPVGTPKNWSAYRQRFVDPIRIAAGVQFWQANQASLERAEAEFGVPAQLIVGIVGVETLYGQNIGSYRVLDALSTLAFDFPKQHPRAVERSAFFKAELESFLTLLHRWGVPPLALKGSYAGAMGLPQFMPSSWLKHGIDFDGDGKVDLFNSPADVIGSVANYFKAFGWKPGMPTHYAVQPPGEADDKAFLLAPDIVPTFSNATLQAKGAQLDANGAQHQGPLALVALQNGTADPHYVAGTENFYVVTRYNWSSYYALAVIELGQAIQDARHR